MRLRDSFLGMTLALLLALVTTTGVMAQSATPEAGEAMASPVAASGCATLLGIGAPDDGCLIFINGISDSNTLDLYVNNLKAVPALRFDDVSGYFILPAGTYNFALVPAGEPLENAIATADDVVIDAGIAYELAGIGQTEAAQVLLSTVDLSPLMSGSGDTPIGSTRIRAIHAVADAGSADVAFIAGDIAERAFGDLSFGQVSEYIDKLAGIYRVILSPIDRDFVTIDLDDMHFQDDTVYSVYAIGDAASGDFRLLEIAIDLEDGSSTPRAIPAALASEIAEVTRFALYSGDCSQLTSTVAFELSGTGYEGAGPGTLAPWGSTDEPSGALGVVPVLYGEGLLDDMNLGDLLGGRTVSVVVLDANSGVVACGEVGGVVEQADRFWEHDRLIIALHPVGTSGITGTATFVEDTGILRDKINVAVSLVEPKQ
jgi:hypothetical protein